MRKYFFKGIVAAFFLLLVTVSSKAEESKKPFVHPLFGTNALLQRDMEVPVWGWTIPGKEVTISINNNKDPQQKSTVTTTAGTDGKWMAKIGPFQEGGPYTLKVSGPKDFTANNIIFGDLWVCSGQSNMEQGIGVSKDADKEISSSANPNIRLFYLHKKIAFAPEEFPEGEWKMCSPENISGFGWGGFSATGYYFGRELNKALNIPIGLIQTAWGGTVAQAWTSAEALNTFDFFQPQMAEYENSVKKATSAEYDYSKDVTEWWEKNIKLPATLSAWNTADFEADKWATMSLPINWEKAGLPGFDGLVLYRKVIELPQEWEEQQAVLSLGPIDDADVTFINGTKVGQTSGWNINRKYDIPAGVLKAGKNVIATQVFDSGGGGGFHGKPEQMTITTVKKSSAKPLALNGSWQYMKMQDKSSFAQFPKSMANNPNIVTVLYNGMISPILPAAIKGAVWYQGESNSGQPEVYQTLLPLMIKDWRSRFTSANGDFPFGIVQLANFMAVSDQPVQDGWAFLREAQLLTAKNTPNTGLAVITDIGEEKDIHPKNKQDVGKRLALWMLGTVYGKDIVYSGPLYEKMDIEGNKVRLSFKHTGGGLEAKGGEPLKWFALAGEDKKWVKADAVIDGDTVVVSSAEVENPVAVRYAWANNPDGANLYNKEGLPASPFRTDSWPRQK